MNPRYDRGASASNWKAILAVDAAMGLVVVFGGFVAAVVWNVWLGAAIAWVGLVYVALVAVRYRRWKALRGE